MDEQTPPASFWRAKLLRITGVILVLLVVIVAIAPQVIAKTSLRNWLLNQLVADAELQASVDHASLGWFSPLNLQGLAIQNQNERMRIDVEGARLDRSWLQVLLSLPDVGSITLDNPRVEIILPSAAESKTESDIPSNTSGRGKNTFNAEVRGASFSIRLEEEENPAIEVEGIDVSIAVKQNGDTRELVIPQATIFDRQKLTPELCEKGLKLVAPVLADSTSVEGSISFKLEDVRVPLDLQPARQKQELHVRGSIVFHDVTTRQKNPLLLEITRILSALLQVDVPNSMRIAEETQVRFHVQDGRVHHEGLSFVLPELSKEIVVETSGSVGLDETLDLALKIPLPFSLLHGSPSFKRLSEKPLSLHVSGTLDDPKISLPSNGNWLNEIVNSFKRDDSIDPDSQATQTTDIASEIIGALGGILERRSEDGGANSAPLLDQIRKYREAQPREAENDPQDPPRKRLFPGGLLPRQRNEPAQEGAEN